MTECIITKVDPSYNQPFIANFQNGQLQSNQVDKLQCLVLKNTKSKEKYIAAATENMTYVGADSNKEELCYTLLTIRNKRTNKVRIVPIKNISLNAVLTKENKSLDSTLNVTKGTIGNLNKQFGSKRDKRRTEQYERMKMNVSNIEKELEQTVADIKINPEDLMTPADENEKFYRPNMNRNASTVDQIYDIKSIIKQSELDTLEELAKNILENDIEDEKYVPFVSEYLQEVKKSKSDNKINKIELLLYIDAILKFFKMNAKTIGRKAPEIEPYPDNICSKIYKEFTVLTDHHRTRPMSMRDKAICYSIVIALLALDFQINLEPFSRSMNVGLKKLMDVSKILGAQQNISKSKNHIILKLPLPQAPSLLGKRKKK